MAPSQLLFKRACNDIDQSDCYDSWWWSSSGYGVRYAIIALIFVGIALLLFGAYFHAQRRIRKGLQPLAYHRWLVSRRRYRATPFPQNNYTYYQQQDPAYPPQQGYPMQNMGGAPHGNVEFQPPPPAYGNWESPPIYQPPQGASKVAANQNTQPMERNDAAGEGASLPPNHAQNNNSHTQ
ncbi:hypothetical protein E4T42_07300 [Aureobasidium subglaciale]|uniref:Uncharacterized protein n=1 Tax=Aureobasidium subglaciale (strain EXF-2481) TaxID=1043005 RepID=A0A074Y6Y3_AURSE|nr:uncharacterized protein AUEXF2481DRAFT_6551 [Aureobasidium subglaciale EXF-2481]KAI5212903.1 hypothetical protein E4T38_00211 [Aureobasidium subglaciale]KAI5232423.1 hypothetical protein E4T40_00210 [Aureobasidium subglaciale]KAI5234866.1 hypothetical protein E4T41_00210 [Aureobasidium subglaciale]KAI5243487.1 hypothetical protein E4T42_07300 [Aureobasidium subglaciale]KAI5268428.1 hypothetical protein E4T46_00210 [Aureobasidium subglaciale]